MSSLQIGKYSNLSFAVIGNDTRNFIDAFTEIGGTFNPNLRCGPGWYFANRHADRVMALINKTKLDWLNFEDPKKRIQSEPLTPSQP